MNERIGKRSRGLEMGRGLGRGEKNRRGLYRIGKRDIGGREEKERKIDQKRRRV